MGNKERDRESVFIWGWGWGGWAVTPPPPNHTGECHFLLRNSLGENNIMCVLMILMLWKN